MDSADGFDEHFGETFGTNIGSLDLYEGISSRNIIDEESRRTRISLKNNVKKSREEKRLAFIPK
jgi:hypothetical protein